MTTYTPHQANHPRVKTAHWWFIALLLLIAGAIGLRWSAAPAPPDVPAAPAKVDALTSGAVATLDSLPFAYSPGWTVSAQGADPAEPADPWMSPSGVISFTYTGGDLLLQLALGDYWGYLFVTVDGAPANRLPLIATNFNQQGEPAGYRTFYAPELQQQNGPLPQWVLIHSDADSDASHEVRIELWRSWGQTPLRAVAVDAQSPPTLPRWPFVALLVLGAGALWRALYQARIDLRRVRALALLGDLLVRVSAPMHRQDVRWGAANLAVLMIGAAIWLRLWWLGPLGLALLAYTSLRQPALWAAALLIALPFYYSQTLPILPARATNLIDVGVLGGLLVVGGAWLITQASGVLAPSRRTAGPSAMLLIFALAGWSLVAASDAAYSEVALREWRTVFLAAALFALLLNSCRVDPTAPWLLLVAWIGGGLLFALIGLGQFAANVMLIEAEGVQRVRSLYGSPNNLALYLERTLMPTLALLLLLPNGLRRWLTLAAAALQGGALLLTFSKGALLLGLPAGLVTLWLGGLYALRRQSRSTRPLWWLAAVAAMAILALLPFLATERFQRLLDFDSGTGFTRLQLWRSSLQMALDHPAFGLGPDNFLYAYRSQYILPAAWQEPNLNHPHTWLLDWWVRLGVMGTALGVSWWALGLWANWQQLCAASAAMRQETAIWLGVVAAMVAALCHGLIDLSYAIPDLMLVWVLLTLLPAIAAPETPNKKPNLD